jgi:small subunit ribosomal protein S5
MSDEIINKEEVVAEIVVDETVTEVTAPEASTEVTLEAEVVTETVGTEEAAASAAAADTSAVASNETIAPRVSKYAGSTTRGPASGNRPASKGGARGGRPARPAKEKPEFDSKAIDVRRVTRVVSGGRRFSLHVTMIAGDRNGRVGLGTGKAMDTQAAMEKALKSARKNMVKFNLDDKKTIKHEVSAKYDTSEVWISPNKGKGLIAGSSARVILNLAGLQNVTAKFHGGTKNKLNNARATMKALAEVSARA